MDLFILYSNHCLFLETIMPLVIHLFTTDSFMYVTFTGNSMLK